jgi:hypothetical protein
MIKFLLDPALRFGSNFINNFRELRIIKSPGGGGGGVYLHHYMHLVPHDPKFQIY